MKKFTFLAAAAFTAIAANAQYTCNPETSVVAAEKPSQVAWIILDQVGQTALENAGASLINLAPDDVNKFFYIWEGTFAGGDGSYPGVDGGEDGYLSLKVGNVGWSGGGYFISEAAGVNLSMFDMEKTRFHVAYMSPGPAPASIALVLADGDNEGSSPAKVALGEAFNDGGAVYPSIGPALNDDWQGVDISFADLKKMYPSFNLAGNMTNWQGNILSILGGGVEGQTLALDCVYFYNVGEGSSQEPGDNEPGDDQPGDDQPGDDQPGDDQPGDDQPGDDQPGDDQPGDDQPGDDNGEGDEEGGVEGIEAEGIDFVVTSHTINLNGANGMVLYDLAGKVVKQTNGCVLGIDNLPKGVYVVKSSTNKVKKVVVK